MDIFTALDDTSKIKKHFRTTKGLVDDSKVRLLPKVEVLQVERSPEECVGLLSSCWGTADPIGCTLGRGAEFLNCITSGQETLVVGVPCKGEGAGTHNLPYSVYQDYLNCVYEDSGGEALCDEFTFTDDLDREITTKIECECPHEKEWNGSGCQCPVDAPYDEDDIVSAGGRMFGNCCAKKICGEGGDYFCDTEVCDCAPDWFDDGEGGCHNDPCSPGPRGGSGCDSGNCCKTIGVCILNDGVWDGTGPETAPKSISECEKQEGRWITTDEDKCPLEGHCQLSICEIDRHYQNNEFVISTCDPYCIAEKCELACQTAEEGNCFGNWMFDSCDNQGTPKTCLCACVPD